MRVSKSRMEVIKKQYFRVTSDMMKTMLVGWNTEWKMEVMSRKRDISHLFENNAEILGGYEAKGVTVLYHGNF